MLKHLSSIYEDNFTSHLNKSNLLQEQFHFPELNQKSISQTVGASSFLNQIIQPKAVKTEFHSQFLYDGGFKPGCVPFHTRMWLQQFTRWLLELRQLITKRISAVIGDSAFQSLRVFFGMFRVQVWPYPGNRRSVTILCFHYCCQSVLCVYVVLQRVVQESGKMRVPPRESCCFQKTQILP